MKNQYEEFAEYLAKIIAGTVSEKDRIRAPSQETGNTAVCPEDGIPLGVSNRHVHLSREDLERLFGTGYEFTVLRDLSQPGQYACKETVTLCGPKGVIEKVRILGPVRKQTQVELLAADSFKLGIRPPVRLSGDLKGTPGLTIVGPKGSIQISEGSMIAQRHIHMSEEDARAFHVKNGDIVSIRVNGLRGGILENVVIRADSRSALECHLDTEEANALGAGSQTKIYIVNN